MAAARATLLAAAVAATAAAATPALGQGTMAFIRSGDHPGYGRIVFDLPPNTSYQADRVGDRVILRFDSGVTVPAGGTPPRNVAGIDGGQGRAEVVLASGGVRHRAFRLGDRVIVDALDESATEPAPGGRRGRDQAARDPAGTPPVQAQDQAASIPQAQPTTPASATEAEAPARRTARATSGGRRPDPRSPLRGGGGGGERPSAPVASAPQPGPPAAATASAAAAAPSTPTTASPAAAGAPAPGPAGNATSPAPPPAAPPSAAAPPTSPPRSEHVLRLPPAQSPAGRTQAAEHAEAAPSVLTAPTVSVSQETLAAALPSSGGAAAPAAAPAGPVVPPSAASHPVSASDRAPAATAAAAAPAAQEQQPALIPAAPDIGAAAFPCASALCLVLDAPVSVPQALLSGFGPLVGAQVEAMPGATLLRLPGGPALRLVRVEQGWQVSRPQAASTPMPITPKPDRDGLLFPVAQPGRVVGIPDQETGQVLLVGTIRGGVAGQAVAAPARRTPEYVIRPAVLGAVVEPLSDQAGLRPVQAGFLLTSAGLAGMQPAVAAGSAADATKLTRRLDLPDLPEAELVRRARAATAAASSAPPMARAKPRLEAAQALLALGLGAEAQGVAEAARSDDPVRGKEPDAVLVQAAAALVAGRPAEAAELDEAQPPQQDGSDEAALWRAIRKAALAAEGAPAVTEAARTMAATHELALAYPAPLRTRLLPVLAETMALGGAGEAADGLLARYKDEPALALARALRAEQRGEADAALAAYDGLIAGRDRPVRARAALRAAELRLANHKATPAEAADMLERTFLAWRGDGLERRMRVRAAELRTQAGSWRQALVLLREAEGLFPEDRAALREKMRESFLAMLGSGAAKPLDLVSLAGEYAEFLPDGPAGEAVSAQLADQLLALDLPARARPVLEKLLSAAPRGPARAAVGARLAALRLQEQDAVGTLAALADSEATPGPGGETGARRLLLRARALSGRGDLAGAMALLVRADSAQADELRVELLEAARDWSGALAAMGSLTARQVPAGPAKLDEAQQGLLVRQAGIAAQAGDQAALRTLRAELPRVAGPQADLFRLLVAEPVRGTADLPRAASEVALARTLPQRGGALAAAR